MKIADLIKQLTEILKQDGNLDIVVRNYEYLKDNDFILSSGNLVVENKVLVIG